jgi:DNA-binding HxlR family transcriptional regulator
MRKSEVSELICPVARAISNVGDQWSLMIIREIFMGSRRFDQFEAQLRAAPALLTARLKELEEAGMVSRIAYQKSPVRYEYRLTQKGLDVWPVIIALKSWGDRWGGFRKPPASLRHRSCGHSAAVRMVCSCCGESIGPENVNLELGPAMELQRSEFTLAKRQKDIEKARARRR